MAEAASAELPAYPMPRGCPFDPPPGYDRLRAERAFSRVTLPTGRSAWLVTGHALVRELLADGRVSADRAHPDFPSLFPGQEGMSKQAKGFLPWMDPPEHTTYRRLVVSEFTVRRVRALRPRIEEIVDERITSMLADGPPTDLVTALALPVPSLAIGELLGVPYQDRRVFQDNTAIAIGLDSTAEARLAALGELRGYLDGLVARRQREPADDLLSALVVKYRGAGVEDREHLTGMALLLLAAGHDTTAGMISLGTLALLENPDQLAALRADPALIPGAVEELLRYLSIADRSTRRFATEDIKIGEFLVRRGEGLLLSNAAGNRDGEVFAHPDVLDVRRDDARQHMAFGHGIHQCLGQNLARVELEVVFSALLSRIPGLRLDAALADLRFKDDAITYGLHSAPVTW